MTQKSRFSIIIPTYNRPDRLTVCLQSMTALDYPAGAWEVILVNDGGAESFTTIPLALKQTLPVRFLDVAHGGPAKARNAGARLAQGDFLVFTDDDCQMNPDWLQQFTIGFEDGKWDALGGHVLNAFPDNAAAVAGQYLVNFLYDYMQDADGNALLLFSGNAAYKRSVFEMLGGYDETFPWAAAEDSELSYRLLNRGNRQRYWLAARVWHCHRLTGWDYVKQQFRFGRGTYFLEQALKQLQINPRIRPRSSTPFYRSLGQALWRVRAPLSAWLLISLSQVAYHAGRTYQTTQAHLASR